ncbi:rhodanese-like domain-containing protein [Micromonospora sp. NPDC050397]|uniref:MBL fold metallo-hydrolase n=1 Tax=Micromonospora sp. NPDC050397 TaxID=3364279 RepID=UPI00384E0A7F
MYFIDTIETQSLGNHSYLAGGPSAAVVIDPPRDVDRIIAAATRRGVRIAYVVETHVHNDYISGGLELARSTGARYLVPVMASVAFDHTPIADGGCVTVDDGLTLRALATPGHTPHHMAYVLGEGSREIAVFTGGSLLHETVGRPDLISPWMTGRLARAQYASAHRLADELDDEVSVLPTHGFGSFCSSTQSAVGTTTIGAERQRNPALIKGVDVFVAELLGGLDDIPAYYPHIGPVNAAGPPPVDLTPPRPADPEQIAVRLAAGEWVVDLRNRVDFADEHVAGSLNFEGTGKLATYLAWLLPWGRPLTLLADDSQQIADAQRELTRVGIDRPVAAATGRPTQWVRGKNDLTSFPRADFTALAAAQSLGKAAVVLDVRRDSERSSGYLDGSVHIPIHQLPDRIDDLPAGEVWVHCVSGLRATIAASLLDAAGRDVVAIDDTFEDLPSNLLKIIHPAPADT